MFQSGHVARSFFSRPCATAASAAAASGLLASPLDSPSECEEMAAPCSITSHGQAGGRRPFSVLIVGSGLTGCLTALWIRQRLKGAQARAAQNSASRPRDVDLTVVERATYPAGRFGATATHRDMVADIGAQVLSTVNPTDHRALGGHGVRIEDIRTSNEIVQALQSEEVISRVNDSKLGETEERMLWEGLWHHYSASSGLRSVLLKLLSWAEVHPQFGVRIDSLSTRKDGTVQVNGVQRSKKYTSPQGLDSPFVKRFDCVILCIPAPDVLELDGLVSHLPSMARHVLEKVRYDQRTCEAHFFAGDMAQRLEKVFNEKIELMLDHETDNAIQYISWQNPKRAGLFGSSGTCALVAHGRTGRLQSLAKNLDLALSKLTGLSEGEISSLRLSSRRISWSISQMITPMEAVVADPPRPAWQCILGKAGLSEGIIIAGDFMTQSSFLGCVATADAAARAAVERFFSDE